MVDWHPGSNHIVRDLVHPSLYCFRLGSTPELLEPFVAHGCLPKLTGSIGSGKTNELIDEDPLEKAGRFKRHRSKISCVGFHMKSVEGIMPYALWRHYLSVCGIRVYQSSPSRFQNAGLVWLPSEFSISSSGQVTIESYINNLHPRRHPQLYTLVAKVFSRLVPLLEDVLTVLASKHR